MDPKWVRNGSWDAFGAKLQPGRLQSAQRNSGYPNLECHFAKQIAPRADFGSSLGPKMAQKSIFEVKLGP